MKHAIIVLVIIIAATGILLIIFGPPSNSPTQQSQELPIQQDESSLEQAESAGMITQIKNLPGAEEATLNPVDESNSSGEAYRVIAEGSLLHQADLYLPVPQKENTFYEGWLVRSSTSDIVSTGVAEFGRERSNTHNELFLWVLNYSSVSDLTDYDTVVITLETVLDEIPEKHVLQGSF